MIDSAHAKASVRNALLEGAERVLIVATHGIGDLIMMLPSVRALSQSGRSVFLLLKGPSERQIVEVVLDDPTLEVLCLSDLPANYLGRLAAITKWIRMRNVDCALAQVGLHPFRFPVLTLLGGIPYRIGWTGFGSALNTRSLEPSGRHKVLENARYLELFGIDCAPGELVLEAKAEAVAADIGIVAIAPSAGDVAAHRAWPRASYAELARRLVAEFDVDVEVLGGPSDVALCESIVSESGSQRVSSLAGKLDIPGLLALLRRRALVVANCNGISHMAAVMGARVVGIYGPTSHEYTGPYSSNLVPITLGLDCSPCYRRGFEHGCGKPICVEDIPVERVYQAAAAELQRIVSERGGGAQQPLQHSAAD